MVLLEIDYLENFPEGKEIILPDNGDVGIDLYSAEDVSFEKGDVKLVPTGIRCAVPRHYWLLIKDRSSVSKHLTTLAGVVDSTYRGQVFVRMLCVAPYEVKKGDKMAQMIVCDNHNPNFTLKITDNLTETKRGSGGFGSTGR